MTKQEKIKEAYGAYWESVKLLTDENGFICQSTLFFPETPMMDKMEIQVKPFPPDGRCYWRPMVLKGIENNNGWIKIESEDDLPKDNGSYFTKTNYCKETIERDYPIFTKSMSIEDERKWWLENITHYQPIIKPNEPLY